MIRGLIKRSIKAGVLDRIDPRICTGNSLAVADLAGKIDFALAFAVVHEVPLGEWVTVWEARRR